MRQYLQETPMLDFSNESIQRLAARKGWGELSDFGVYDSPDELLREHGQEMTRTKAFIYRHVGRHLINRNVCKIREG